LFVFVCYLFFVCYQFFVCCLVVDLDFWSLKQLHPHGKGGINDGDCKKGKGTSLATRKSNSPGQEEASSEARKQSASINHPGRILGCLFGR